MSRGRRKEQQAAVERKRDWNWISERDDDQAREEIPDDEYLGHDEHQSQLKDCRS